MLPAAEASAVKGRVAVCAGTVAPAKKGTCPRGGKFASNPPQHHNPTGRITNIHILYVQTSGTHKYNLYSSHSLMHARKTENDTWGNTPGPGVVPPPLQGLKNPTVFPRRQMRFPGEDPEHEPQERALDQGPRRMMPQAHLPPSKLNSDCRKKGEIRTPPHPVVLKGPQNTPHFPQTIHREALRPGEQLGGSAVS